VITLRRFKRLEADLRADGYSPMIEWSQSIAAPAEAHELAERAIFVICNSGLKYTVARPIFERCMTALRQGRSAGHAFGHPGKARAIDAIWTNRQALFDQFATGHATLELVEKLPWIGPVTKYHLAKNLGIDTAKPDIHLERLARRDGTTPHRLCKRLARQTGYRLATIDTILWRACADGILSSSRYEVSGWREAYRGRPRLRNSGP
jgi:hypothetical protein